MTDAAPYLLPAAIRERIPDLTEANFSDEDLAERVAEFEPIAERARGCAFTTRTATRTFQITGWRPSVILEPLIQSIDSLTVNGNDVTATQRLNAEAGILSVDGGFGCGELVVEFTYGYETPPASVLRACRLYVWREAMADRNPNSGNTYQTTQTDVNGNLFTERQSTPDWSAGRFTGWMDVDKILNQLPDYRTPGIG